MGRGRGEHLHVNDGGLWLFLLEQSKRLFDA